MEKNWEELSYEYALENAISHDGKAQESAVLGHLFREGLEKKDIEKIMPVIKEKVRKVNSLRIKEQEKEFENFKGKFLALEKEKVEKSEKKDLPELQVKGKIVTRLAPEPSKYNHVGHAISFLINYMYAKKYKGKCKLRFEDTNPEKARQEYVDAMKKDVLDYLDIKVSEIRYVSDDIPKLYKYAEKLIKDKKAFMCFCRREKLKKLRDEGIECSCRQHEVKKNMKEWKSFLKGKYMKGETSLRLKGNMESDNYVMRDPVIFRAVAEKHYRKPKYKIWPMYDFYNPIEDSLMGVTHIFRSNEFDVRVELQEYIKDLLKLKKQEIVQYGRFNIQGIKAQGRELRELVESGKYIGWDDPRLPTLKAMERRGIVKETFYELVRQFGFSKHQVNVDFDIIASINRKLIDKKARRYFFISEPVELEIENAPEIKEIEVKVHPDAEEIRKISIGNDIFIDKKDFDKFHNQEVRLMHLFNIKLREKPRFTSQENKDIPKLQWVSDFVKVRILMPEGNWIDGIAEQAVKKLKLKSIIQFERFGFARFDKINDAGVYEFWFSHQ